MDDLELEPLQAGRVGDMTASRKVTIYDVADEDAAALIKKHRRIPAHKANTLFLEWFGTRNGRVVIEATDFDITVSEPAWLMSNEVLQRQVETNKESFREWLQQMDDWIENEADDDTDEDNRPLDEFEWEQVMRETDRRAEKLDEVLAKYEGHPDSEKLIAREMGWTWLEDELEAQERGIVLFSEADDNEDEVEDFDLPDPNPLTHGVNWVRDEEGNVCHPLALRAAQVSMRLGHYLVAARPSPDTSAQAAQEMLLYAQLTATKLAGVLNHLAYDDVDLDNGFIVAGLKRGLHFLHKTIHAGASAGVKKRIDSGTRRQIQQALFALREDIIDMMNRHRRGGL
jgi:hypothetical protein